MKYFTLVLILLCLCGCGTPTNKIPVVGKVYLQRVNNPFEDDIYVKVTEIRGNYVGFGASVSRGIAERIETTGGSFEYKYFFSVMEEIE